MRKSLLYSLLFFPLFSFGKIVPLSPKNCDPASDSLYVKYVLDSMRAEMEPDDGTTLYGGNFTYAPGNWFKVLVIEGEGCGAYCNPNNYSWIFYESDGILVRREVDICPSHSFYELDYKRKTGFLVLDQVGVRPRGVESALYCSAQYILIDDSLHFGKFPEHGSTAPEEYFSISLSIFCEDSCQAHEKNEEWPTFKYDPKKKKLTYKTYYYYDNDWDRCYLMSGEFVFRKGMFVEVNWRRDTNPEYDN